MDEFRGALGGVACKLASTLGEHKATTDSNGAFKFEKVIPGKYTLSASRTSYITAIEPVEVTIEPSSVELVLSSGDSFLEVVDTMLMVSNNPGQHQFQVKSNAHWEVSTDTPWITLANSSGSGNGILFLSWQASYEDYNRVGVIEVKSGSLRSRVRITQEPSLKILATDVVYGNLVVGATDSIIVEFSKIVTITSLSSNYVLCAGGFNFKHVGRRLALTYSCGKIGGSYPLTINGKVGQDPFTFQLNMNYYSKRKTLPGSIYNYFIAPDNQTLWAITSSPNKLIQLSLPDLTVLKELTIGFTPGQIRWNDYAQMINIFGQGYCHLETVVDGTCTQNRLTYVDPNSLAISSSPIHHIPDYYFYGNNAYPYVFPRDIALFSDGTGIVQLSNDYDYLLWRFIDGPHNDTTYNGSIHVNLPAYDLRYQSIFTNHDKSKIYLMHPWASTSIDIYERGQSTFRTYNTPHGGHSNKLVPHKKANWMYHGELYQQFVSDLDAYDSWYTYLDTRYYFSGIDFSYRTGEEEIVYYLGDGLLLVLDYRYGFTPYATEMVETMFNIQTTTDGVGMTSLRPNNGTTDVFYFPLDLLMHDQVPRTSPGGRSASQSRSKFESIWVKK